MPASQRLAVASALLMPLLLAWPSQAQEAKDSDLKLQDLRTQQNPVDLRGTWSVVIENDKFIAGTDRDYTTGTHLSWLSAADDVPDWADNVARSIPLLAGDGKKRIGYNFGQSIFTPEDTESAAVVPDERPYAGWLYGGVALLSETPNSLDTMELDLGVVGPLAMGEQVQNSFHKLIGSPESNGWDNQLDNEPGILLIYEKAWRSPDWRISDENSRLGFDVTPHVGATLGNVFTYAATGIGIRLGQNLPSDFGPPRIRPGLTGAGFFDLDAGDYGWYFFASAEGRAVARNIFLDGNTFSDSHSVDKEPFVGDFQLGFAFMVSTVRLTYAQVFRTPEYKNDDFDSFGTISLSMKF
ncbi:MAG TPA: lipid A deacylase LpxR family protein [Alphaproteobacteria bacterium]|jgi:hypothetical protein